MKAKEVIRIFQEKDPEEEVIIDWWDKECFSSVLHEEEYPSNDTWVKVVTQWEEKSMFGNMISNDIWEWINDALIEESEDYLESIQIKTDV